MIGAPISTKLIRERRWQDTGQWAHAEQLVQLGTVRVRAQVRLDSSHHSQSYARAHVWSDAHGWLPLVSIPYPQMHTVQSGISSYATAHARQSELSAAFTADLNELLVMAEEVLR